MGISVCILTPFARHHSARAFGTAMKPTRAQLFFASPWPGRIWFTAIPLIVATAVAVSCAGFIHPLSAWWDFARFGWFVLLALLLGFFLAMFPGWLIIGPFSYGREVKNGGPFKVGDRVQILSRPHCGRVSRVYSTWQGNTLRVELSAREKEERKDIFPPLSSCAPKIPNPALHRMAARRSRLPIRASVAGRHR